MIAQLTSTNTNMGPFWSTQQYMYVQFLSDMQYSGRGFNATFVSVTREYLMLICRTLRHHIRLGAVMAALQ
jgi:hypothetical protein